MRLAVVILACVGSAAVAETADDLVHKGEQLARAGRYSEAIDAFKAADRASPRASHACLIALAYTRRELWPQAEIFLARCRERATAAEPLPEWVPLAEKQLKERLATVSVAAIELVVEPSDVRAELSVSSFAPDEVFAPRTIHLPPGHHVVTARAAGYADAQEVIDVVDQTPKRVTIRLRAPNYKHVRGRQSWYVIGAGGAVTAAAIAYHATVYRSAYDKLEATRNQSDYPAALAQYQMLEPDYRAKQRITWALYGAGLATVVTGIALRYAGVGDTEIAVRPIEGGGGILSVGWRR